ncbi:MAG: tRNA1(Val) (adenine(37)-N6)-methyltransferase [Treponema sp.]|nr:tRNA1(Val) (adenine(37)-N6)-methyltransferase [Treponema sp.]
MEVVLKADERVDVLKKSGYKIIQNPKGFCFGVDAVLLAGFSKVRRGETICDLGTGNGALPLLMAHRSQVQFFGVEIQKDAADMAMRSVLMNDLSEKIQIVQGDLKDAFSFFEKNAFAVVLSNPPYMTIDCGKQNLCDLKNIARHEIFCTLDDIVRIASGLLNSHGRFYMIHRPERLQEILCAFEKYNLSAKRMRFVFPFIDKSPTMILIEGVKSAKKGVVVEKPLVMYQPNGEYTEEMSEFFAF